MFKLPLIKKLVKPTTHQLKKLMATALPLGFLATGMTLLQTEPASAFCVYNNSEETITALQLPINGSSFKQKIEPGEDKCCAWDNGDCNNGGGRIDKAKFLILKGAVPNALTFSLGAVAEANDIINYFADDLNTSVAQDAIKIKDKILGLVEKYDKQVSDYLGMEETYNGGVITYDGEDEPFGCWVGPCQAQWINNDGSEGLPENLD